MFLVCTTERRKMPYTGMEEVGHDVWVTLDLFHLEFLLRHGGRDASR